MKNFIIKINILAFLVLFSACRTHIDTLPVKVEETLVMPTEPSFKGVVLGTNVTYLEKADKWRSSLGFAYKHDPNTTQYLLYVTPIASFTTIASSITELPNLRGFTVDFPSSLTSQEINSLDHIMNNLISVGKKNLLYAPTTSYGHSLGYAIDKFIFYYYDISYTNPNHKPIKVSTVWGSQEGSTFEIVSSKEVPKEPYSDAKKSFLVTFNVDCKMYEQGGKYVGNIKGLLTYRWDYRLF